MDQEKEKIKYMVQEKGNIIDQYKERTIYKDKQKTVVQDKKKTMDQENKNIIDIDQEKEKPIDQEKGCAEKKDTYKSHYCWLAGYVLICFLLGFLGFYLNVFACRSDKSTCKPFTGSFSPPGPG